MDTWFLASPRSSEHKPALVIDTRLTHKIKTDCDIHEVMDYTQYLENQHSFPTIQRTVSDINTEFYATRVLNTGQ